MIAEMSTCATGPRCSAVRTPGKRGRRAEGTRRSHDEQGRQRSGQGCSDRDRARSFTRSPASASPTTSQERRRAGQRRARGRAASDADWPARKRRTATRADGQGGHDRQACRRSPSTRRPRRAVDRRRTSRHRSPTRLEITLRQPQPADHGSSPEALAQEVLDEVVLGPTARRGEPIGLGIWRPTAPPAEPAVSEAPTVGPGGSDDPAEWPLMWAEQETRLEPLSRALAAALRHDKDTGGCLALEECRPLGADRGTPWTTAEVLLVAAMSTRRCGQRRFEAYVDEYGGYTIEAQVKLPGSEAAKHRPPRMPTRKSSTSVTKADLDAEIEGWGQPATRSTAGSSSRAIGAPVQAKLKRKRGSRGNPNRPSQIARSARLAEERAEER